MKVLKTSLLKTYCQQKYFCKLIEFNVVDYSLKKHQVKTESGSILFDALINSGVEVESDCNKDPICARCHCIVPKMITNNPDYIKPCENEVDISYKLSPYTK